MKYYVAHPVIKYLDGLLGLGISQDTFGNYLLIDPLSVADPGFRPGAGANSSDGGGTYGFAKFSQKLYEIERFLKGGGAHPKFCYVAPLLFVATKLYLQ